MKQEQTEKADKDGDEEENYEPGVSRRRAGDPSGSLVCWRL